MSHNSSDKSYRSFYFIRHGETELNRQERCVGGKTDVPLNDTGIQQARKLKKQLLLLNITNVVSSPMLRARQTAEIAINQPHLIQQDLREWEIGIFEEAPLKDFLDYTKNLSKTTTLPGGESRSIFLKGLCLQFTNSLKSFSTIGCWLPTGVHIGRY
jgi:broad specificity phosphatase PhoE